MRLENRTRTRRLDTQRLTVAVKQLEGEAGIRSMQVTPPKALARAAKNAKGLCKLAPTSRSCRVGKCR